MLSYSQKCGQNTKSINPLALKAINGGRITLSKCVVCNTKKSRFIKKEQAKRLLSNLSIRKLLSAIPLSKIPLLRNILF